MRFRVLRSLVGSDMTRWWLGFRAAEGPLKDYYRTDTATLDRPYDEVDCLAIDLETTGLDPANDEILSVGFVPIVAGRIRLAQAETILIRPTRPVSHESVVVHGLTEAQLVDAPPLKDAMPRILAALTGRVPVAHHARVEREFLSKACRRLYGFPLETPFIDTMALERRALERKGKPVGPGDLKLGACRARYGLPRYRAHDALRDALAAGELFLAQAALGSGRKKTELRDLVV